MEAETFLQLRRLKEKRARYNSHAEFLGKCLNNSIIPEGFKIHWEAELDIDETFQEKCRAVKNDTSLRLIAISKQACEAKLSNLSEVIHKQEESLDASFADSTDRLEEYEGERVQRVKDKKWQKLLGCDNTRFREVTVKPDGNCFYRCLSIYLYKDENHHEQVRNEIVEYMIDNRRHFQCFVDGQYDLHMRDQTYSDGRRESWATEAEIHAASALYEMNIKVTRKLTTNMHWLTHISGIQTNKFFIGASWAPKK